MRSFVALLRAVNVGKGRAVPMAELRALFEALGLRDVRTYIQSGNVVFTGGPPDAERLSRALSERFGFAIPVVVRSGEVLDAILEACPWAPEGPDDKRIHVGFLGAPADPARVARMDPERSPGDAFVVGPWAVYLRFGAGVAGSKLTNDWLERQLGTTVTLRNLATCRELTRMASEAAGPASVRRDGTL